MNETIKQAIEEVHKADNNRLSQILGIVLAEFENYQTITHNGEAQAVCEAIREAAKRLTVDHTTEIRYQKQIIQLARDVRSAQRAYFKTRSQNGLIRSRTLESQLDKALNDYFNPQTKLFNS